MPAAVIGGSVRYPSLDSIASLFRAQINDSANNTMGSGTGSGDQAGLIMSNSNPDLLTFMDSAIQELFSDLRNVGDPELILDNYIVTGIPPLTAPNPAVQVSLGYMGYFNGFTWDPTRVLPISVSKMLAMWERQSSSSGTFSSVSPTFFRVRCAVSSGTVAVNLTVTPFGDALALNARGQEIGIISVAGGSALDIVVAFSGGSGTIFFDVSSDGTNWFPYTPASVTANYVNEVALPLPHSPSGGQVPSASNVGFVPMSPAPFGLPGVMQGQRMGMWEMRQGQIWMPGCMQATDLRLRARITYPVPHGPSINFATAYVPIVDSRNAIVAKMMILYAKRFAPEQYGMCISEEDRLMQKLKLEVVRQMQSQENQRAEFGGDAVSDFAIAFSWL